MKLNERIALLKAGYTKEEISQLIEEDKNAEQPAEQAAQPVDAPVNDYMGVIQGLAAEVKALKDAVHAKNIQNAEAQGAPEKSASDILAELFNTAPTPKKEN